MTGVAPKPPFPKELSMSQPMMPKATALWLIENTALSFQQIYRRGTIGELTVSETETTVLANLIFTF